MPTHLLAAPAGHVRPGAGAAARDAVAAYDEQLDHLTTETVPDVNHYTILFDHAATKRLAEVLTA